MLILKFLYNRPEESHIAYDFNHYSSSKKEYNNAIDNFDKIKSIITKNAI